MQKEFENKKMKSISVGDLGSIVKRMISGVLDDTGLKS